MIADRIFGLVMLFAAAGYIFAAQQAQSGFMSDPIGPRAFPTLVGAVSGLCALMMILRPDPDPEGNFGWHALEFLLAVVAGAAFLFLEYYLLEHYGSAAWAFAFYVPVLIAFLIYMPMAAAVFLLLGYALLLKPIGFIVPTIFAAGLLSYQISERPVAAAFTGLGLALGLFILFKFILDLGLVGISEEASPYLPFLQPAIDSVGAGFDWLGQFIPDFTPAEATTQSGGD